MMNGPMKSMQTTARRIARQRTSRRNLLRELALTLNHEFGNALVSLATFRQSTAEQPLTPPMLETVKSDVSKLEILNDQIGLMHSLHEPDSAPADMR